MSTLHISAADRIREAALHAHAEMQVAFKMVQRNEVESAWLRIQRGYDLLDKALDTSAQAEAMFLSDQPLLSILASRKAAVQKVIQEAGNRWRE